jgi:hypothetical protein
MSIEGYAKSLLTEVTGKHSLKNKTSVEPEIDRAPKKPEPNKADPEEVQYPGYFKGKGSL